MQRTWWQHFEPDTTRTHERYYGNPVVEVVKQGRPYCLYCTHLLLAPADDSPFCSEKCASGYFCAATQSSARRQLRERELGVCQKCGFNTLAFFQRFKATTSEQERLQMLMSSKYPVNNRSRKMLTDPKEGDFWEADHIVPVEMGGGETSLDNFQTLCTPCHAEKTRAQAEESKKRKREAAAEGTADLRAMWR